MANLLFHPLDLWLTKDANAFINKNLTLVKDLKRELESNLQPDKFLGEYKKIPGYKLVFKVRAKLQASMRSQCASFIPLFIAADDTLEGCGTGVITNDHPNVVFT